MLDNLFNTILVLSFLALCAYGSLGNQSMREDANPQLVTQLDRVVIIGHSIKTSGRV